MGHLVTLATCSLNQLALDWHGNLERILQSIQQAKAAGATLRVGPELEVSGYDCLDHFLENDIYVHSWEVIKKILEDRECYGILIDVGMPIRFKSRNYNARLLIRDGKILLIRPKMYLANDGVYREMRYFTAWSRRREIEKYYLPRMIHKLQGAETVPIGDAIIITKDTCVGAETCEELFTPAGPHIPMGLDGVEIFTNSSASHHSLRKLNQRMSLILEATRKVGGVYLYSNMKGFGGDRVYYDGGSMIVVNGNVVAQGSQFSLDDVEVITATVDLESVKVFRNKPSFGVQAEQNPTYIRIEAPFSLSKEKIDLRIAACAPRVIHYHDPSEEIALGPACFLWDYLRRSGAAGFLLPLSGGVDSCATAVIVFSMCRLVHKAIQDGKKQVIDDVKRIAGRLSKDPDWLPKSEQELCRVMLHTLYMGMKEQSSQETRDRAKDLAQEIGAYHIEFDIDDVYNAQKSLLFSATGFEPKFRVHGGSATENLALQNIQARTRMVTAYEFAQLLPTIRGAKNGGSLLVLGSANVDESLFGYLTKYDCSSADINPVGSISKIDLKIFIAWAQEHFDLPILRSFLDATPTAELEPITEDYVQSDEADMELTYAQLSEFGRLRKIDQLGPFGQFEKLLHVWKNEMTPREIATKVKHFNHKYAVNRHKMSVMTPSIHVENYSPDDHRHDHRPLVLPPRYTSLEYQNIEEAVLELEQIGLDDQSQTWG